MLAPEAKLILEDGTVYRGFSVGAEGSAFGEIVFNTSVTGYQEILTDPSYRGQVVVMTQPELGNYGVNPEDVESGSIHAAGFVMRRLSTQPSSWRAKGNLADLMREQRIVGIEGVDTRALTRKIRTMGALKVGITTEPVSDETFLLRVREQPSLSEQTDLVGRVSTANPYQFRQDKNRLPAIHLSRVVVVDYGVKAAILKTLQGLAQHVVVLPAHSTFEAVQSYDPQAVVLSNGPGDPVVLEGPIQLARQLVEAGLPTLGICLGHQILGLACGAQAVKMRFGHHGGNHPVLDKDTQRIAITSQNHSYAIDAASLAETDLTTTHVNLYDGSLEGFRHHLRPVMSLQFHPEAHPGPHDALGLFARFVNLAAVAA